MRRRSFLAALLTSIFKPPTSEPRYLFALTSALVYENTTVKLSGFRQLVSIGTVEPHPWRFVDGNVSWHLRRLAA